MINITMEQAAAFSRNAAQALGLMAFVGMLAGLARWKHAARKDFLLSFIIFLLGTVISQVPVHLGGMTGWGPDLVFLSGVGRMVQNLGAALFIVASLRDHCPRWGWISLLAAISLVTIWVP